MSGSSRRGQSSFRVRALALGLFILELPILLPLVAGAVITGLTLRLVRSVSAVRGAIRSALGARSRDDQGNVAVARAGADRASRIAAVVAFVVAAVALFAWPLIRSGDLIPAGSRATTTTQKQTVTKPDAKKTTTTTRTTESPGRTSMFDRALGDDEGALLLRLAALGLVTFFAGAFTQRVILANYQVALGPIELPALDSEEVKATVAQVAGGLPDARVAIPAGETLVPQEPPLFADVEEPRARFVALRVELEARLRRLAAARGVDGRRSIRSIVAALKVDGVYDESTANALEKLLDMGDQAVKGAEVAGDVLDAVGSEQTYQLLHSLARLTAIAERRAEAEAVGRQGGNTYVDELMSGAATDEFGRVVVERVATPNDGTVWMPVDEQGEILRAWVDIGSEVPVGTARRPDGTSLVGLAALSSGIVQLPLDDDGKPVVSLAAEVFRGRQILYGGTSAPPPDWTVPLEREAAAPRAATVS